MSEHKIDRELVECAKINFENFERSVPQIKAHPFWKIAKGQLDEALGYGTLEEALGMPKDEL
jgi:hypothetical protein